MLRCSLLWLSLAFGAVARSSDGNHLPDPDLESRGALRWRGSSAVVSRSAQHPHSGNACLYVKDGSDSQGPANNPHIDVLPGQHDVEAWLRVALHFPGVVTFDAQFFDRSGTYLCSQ